MLINGFISLHRSLLKWEWYDDINTSRMFIHLLLTANYYDTEWHGIQIKRGQRVVSLPKLATELSLTIQQTRTTLNHLKSTNEITCSASPKNTIITILQYDKYQTPTDKTTDNQQTINTQINRQSTDNQQQSNNINKANKEIKNNKTINYSDFPFFTSKIKDNVFEFIEHRKQLKKPLSKYSLELLLKKLESLSSDTEIQKQILTQSIENGWQGIFELKTKNNYKSHKIPIMSDKVRRIMELDDEE